MKKIIYDRPDLARNLKAMMTRDGVNQKDIHVATGVSQSTVSRYLRGTTEATRVFIFALAAYFRVTPEWLLGQKEAEKTLKLVKNPQTAGYNIPAGNPGVVKDERHPMHDAIDRIMTSHDATTILALKVNINMFLEKVKEKQDKKKLKNRLKRIEKEIEISKQSRAVGIPFDFKASPE